MEYSATIVAQTYQTKPEALAIIAAALALPVTGTATAHSYISLARGGRVEVEIPKFGESLPLAIDVYSRRSAAEARTSAQNVLEILTTATGWQIEHLHD
ncbi:hypothetical protein [Cryobacterium roopkundense]|uniref:Uncharacterized protein n=1 Tax=Cryobacterium roopkundense TaxID=1001240 RepID=A0A7W8ZT71_9MICO|nr:hypothetical protein [Cryobacterium roopkundense]MBB5639751.1 hypothetical protein [Cryobacterium roopkundense]